MDCKHLFTLLLLCWNCTFNLIQAQETVLTAPENWQSEIIPFPLSFAPTIDFVGFEDLRFAPQWSDSTSQTFWTYCFVWYIEPDAAMTEHSLTEAFERYYDGLMGIDRNKASGSNQENSLDPTICLFVKTKEGFTGKMRVYDAFFTKDCMTLNILVEESLCPKTNKQIVRCDISPQAIGHEIWDLFDDVHMTVPCE